MKIFLIFLLTLILIPSVGLNIYLYNQWQSDKQTLQTSYNNLQKKAINCIQIQRNQKNEIADIWQDQGSLNQDLVDNQRTLISAGQDYIRLVERSVRFIENQAVLSTGVKESDFVTAKNALNQASTDLGKVALDKSDATKRNDDKINQLYLSVGESRNNTANERNTNNENCLN